MTLYNSLLDTIGNTPLVKLHKIIPAGSEVYVKIESRNPGGSAKDRTVLSMINDAEARRTLQAGGTIIEPTSGNTGIAIAMIAAVRGYKAVMVMPDTMSKERMSYMRAYGAELVLTPGKLGMQGAVDKAKELQQSTPNSVILDQFGNAANAAIHRTTTGREILADLPDVAYVVAGFGTGGTVTGIARALHDAGSDAEAVGVEPTESPLITSGHAGPHKIQGIGANFIPGNLDRSVVKIIATVKGDDAIVTTRRLAREEGIFTGISAGAAVWEALQLASQHPGKKIVAILPDGGDKYVSMGIYD